MGNKRPTGGPPAPLPGLARIGVDWCRKDGASETTVPAAAAVVAAAAAAPAAALAERPSPSGAVPAAAHGVASGRDLPLQ